ncbi:phosphodiesterase [Streptomyces sp. NPDC126497]|uniref:phosphodiesterase n=1 Tax=Streptomyces sp. NPDC126497 TaxID=3155313 RepID=UPI00332A4D80
MFPGISDGAAHRVAERLARWRAAPALHPHGVLCSGTLDVPGSSGEPWGVPWLDRPGSYAVTVRWSRALGLPRRLPDALGLALRVTDAGGPGSALDLLFTSSGSGRLGRHLPLPRPDALTGPYSTLLSYRMGGRERVLAAFPVPAPGGPSKAARPALWQELARRPLRFDLRAAAPGEPWCPFASLTLERAHAAAPATTVSYDPYAHSLPDLRPTRRLSGLRAAAYAGSRRGRSADGRGGRPASSPTGGPEPPPRS